MIEVDPDDPYLTVVYNTDGKPIKDGTRLSDLEVDTSYTNKLGYNVAAQYINQIMNLSSIFSDTIHRRYLADNIRNLFKSKKVRTTNLGCKYSDYKYKSAIDKARKAQKKLLDKVKSRLK